MRLSSVVVAVVFLLSSVVFAQHSSGGGGGSSGGSSGGGSHASSGGSSSGSSSHASSSSGSSGGGSSHSSSGHASAGSSGASSGHTSAHNSARNSGSGSHHSSVASSRSNAASRPGAKNTAQPGKRSFFSFLRHLFRGSGPKPTEADLRQPVCKGEDCKKPAPKPPDTTPAPVESELRRPVCKGKACSCPPGEVQGKNGGCVAAPTNNSGCVVGQLCADSAHQCSANTYWNGASCVARQTDCATINARAASLASEVRAAKAQMQSACSNNSPAQGCSGEKQNYDGAVERYRMLMNAAPANCRSLVPDPLSL